MPFNPRLSKHLIKLDSPLQGQGYLLTVFFIDSETGIVKAMRGIGLETEFSQALQNKILEAGAEDVEDDYNQKLNAIYQKMTTRDLLNFKIAEI